MTLLDIESSRTLEGRDSGEDRVKYEFDFERIVPSWFISFPSSGCGKEGEAFDVTGDGCIDLDLKLNFGFGRFLVFSVDRRSVSSFSCYI